MRGVCVCMCVCVCVCVCACVCILAYSYLCLISLSRVSGVRYIVKHAPRMCAADFMCETHGSLLGFLKPLSVHIQMVLGEN